MQIPSGAKLSQPILRGQDLQDLWRTQKQKVIGHVHINRERGERETVSQFCCSLNLLIIERLSCGK